MLKLTNLSKSYKDHEVLHDVNLEIGVRGNISGLVGASGSGKTTLLNILFGLDQDFTGTYAINGKDTKTFSNHDWDLIRSRDIQLVFQDFKLLRNLTVLENLYYADHLEPDTFKQRAEEILEALGLSTLRDKNVTTLSGGQKQRVSLARAVINRPGILLLDEPTGNLDDHNTQLLMAYLTKLAKIGIAIIVISHDQRIIEYCDDVYQLAHQQIKKISSAKSDQTTLPKYQQPNIQPGKFAKRLRYVLQSLRATWKEQLLAAIPAILIMTSFILIFTFFRSATTESFKQLFAGYDDRTISMNTQDLNKAATQKLSKLGVTTAFDGERLAFRTQDLDNIKQIDHVASVFPFNAVTSVADPEDYLLSFVLEKKNFPQQVKKQVSYTAAPDQVSFSFASLMLPPQYLRHYNSQNIQLLAGKFPQQKKEVLIPDLLAMATFKTDKISQTINQPIKLKVNHEKKGLGNRNYKIAGVYASDYQSQINAEQLVYTPYDSDTMSISQTDYQESKVQLNDNSATEKFNRNMLGSYDQYKKASGTGLSDVIVIADSAENVASVSKELSKLFPMYQQSSQYAMKHGDFHALYRNLTLILTLGSALIALVFGLIISFMNKSKIRARNKEFATLYSLGYSRRSVRSIILIENVLQYLSFLIVAFLLTIPIRMLLSRFSQYAQLLTGLFDWQNLLMIFGYSLLIMLVSVLWGFWGIKRSQLRKYLA